MKETGALTTTTRVGSQGALLYSADGLFSLEIPAGALSETIDVAITSDDELRVAEQLTPTYRVEPTSLVFAIPATARLQAPAQWAGELRFGPTVDAPLRGAFHDMEQGQLVAQLRVLNCAGRTCETSSACVDGAACIDGGCAFDCAIAHDCSGAVTAPSLTCGVGSFAAFDVVPATTAAPDGWDDAPSAGVTFITSSLAIAAAGQGFDIDGQCTSNGDCVDNVLSVLAFTADQQRQTILGGEQLLLMEIAGLDQPYTGSDASVTIKFYDAADADDPAFPGNNFSAPPGETGCCDFKVRLDSLNYDGHARARVPGRIRDGRLESVGAFAMHLPRGFGGEGSTDLQVERAHVAVKLSPDGTSTAEYLLGGAISARSLAASPNPYCRTQALACPWGSGNLLELVASVAQPDVDLSVPADGLDRFELDAAGHIARCSQGCPDNCRTVGPAVVGDPRSCPFTAEIHDGYSVALAGRAVRARIVGVTR